MRDEVLMELVDRAMNDPEFKKKARADLQGALGEYGYELTTEEYEAVNGFQAQTAAMAEQDVERAFAGNGSAGTRQFA